MANQISQEKIQSREQMNKEKRENKSEKQASRKEKQSKRGVRIRLIPIWLRLILIIILVSGSLAGGLMVGYGVMGDGKPKEVFKKATWTHIIDFVQGK